MQEITVENAIDELRSRGWLPADVAARAELLAGGVSNLVIRIAVAGSEDMVLKQSREQLRTEDEWRSRLDRIWREAAVQRVLSSILPAGTVPRVLFEDRTNYLYAMEAIEADHVVWKTALLRGEADVDVAKQAARTLAAIHSRTAGMADLETQFSDVTVFDELRLDPFYRFVAKRHPELAAVLNGLIEQTLTQRVCLVLADFSPKNILLTSQGIALVDFETAHFGDPAFDLGFFLSHLLLKSVFHAGKDRAFLRLAEAAWATYVESLGPIDDPVMAIGDLAGRTVLHLGGCLLARIDGKSPVDYLDESQRGFVRSFCVQLLEKPPSRPETVMEWLADRLSSA